MSESPTRQLQAGEYYGSVTRRRRLSGAVLSELKHIQPRALPRHSHELGYFSFLLGGDYEEWYGRRITIHKPRTLMWHPGALQHQDAVGGRGCHFFNLEVAPARLDALRDYAAFITGPCVLPGDEAGWLMMRLYREFRAAESGCDLAMEGLTLELLAALARRPERMMQQKPPWLLRVEARLREEFQEKHTMRDLAVDAGIHPVHLAAVFRRFHRATVGEFVQRLRVEAACELLGRADTPLSDIALHLGFADQAHFSRVFRRWTGMPPRVWRRLASRTNDALGA